MPATLACRHTLDLMVCCHQHETHWCLVPTHWTRWLVVSTLDHIVRCQRTPYGLVSPPTRPYGVLPPHTRPYVLMPPQTLDPMVCYYNALDPMVLPQRTTRPFGVVPPHTKPYCCDLVLCVYVKRHVLSMSCNQCRRQQRLCQRGNGATPPGLIIAFVLR